ncbi:MAG: MBL fold metallo-hydrolase [Chloroflexi bacterium]|nr:MBL fold metallo-hydrolase [Chloroflexota bacterium]
MPNIEVLLSGLSVGTDQTRLGLSTVALIRGTQNILVDVAHMGRRENLLAALESHHIAPEDIHIVVLTHSHWDHATNIDLFPKARFFIHPAEMEYARDPRKGDWATPRYFTAIMQGLKVVEVKEGMEVAPGVRIVDTPGHTKGHISVLVETHEGPVVLAGDAFSDAGCLTRGQPALVFWSVRQSKESIRRMLDLSQVVYPGHDRPFRLVNGRPQYLSDAPASIEISGLMGEDRGGFRVLVYPQPPVRPGWVLPEAQD